MMHSRNRSAGVANFAKMDKKREGDSEKMLLPSKVTNQKYIHMPNQSKVVDSDDEWMQCGKWVWVNHGDSALLDKNWMDLQCLLTREILLMIKASTAENKMESGVILCYTRPGKDEAKRAAEAIREIIEDDCLLYYKTNDTTENNIARPFRFWSLSKYMYTVQGRFYEKDHLQRWLLDDGTLSTPTVQLSYQDEAYDTGSTKSTTEMNESNLDFRHPAYRKNEGGYWFLKCDISGKDQNGWTEDVRVWKVAKHLLDEGIFNRIMYLKEAQKADIKCFISNYSDIQLLIECAKKIIRKAHYVSNIHFYVGGRDNKYKSTGSDNKYKYTGSDNKYKYTGSDNKYKYTGSDSKYKYTAEGELYEKNGRFYRLLLY